MPAFGRTPPRADARAQHGQVRVRLEAPRPAARAARGAHTSSASMRARRAARAACAAGVERGHESRAGIRRRTRTRGSRRAASSRIARLPSVARSSTATTSWSARVCAAREARHSPRVAAASRTGRRTRDAREGHSWRPTNSRASRRAHRRARPRPRRRTDRPRPAASSRAGPRRISASQPCVALHGLPDLVHPLLAAHRRVDPVRRVRPIDEHGRRPQGAGRRRG